MRILVAALLLAALPASALEVAGVSVPESYLLDGKTLVLNGAGVRTKTFLKVKVYVGALYLPQHSTDAADSWVQGSDWKIDSIHVAGDTIVIKVFGPGEPPAVEDLKAAVRRDVPSDVPVEVVEESGTTTQL